MNRKWWVERLSVSRRKARGSPRQGLFSGYDTVRLPPFQYNSYHSSCALKIRNPILGIFRLYLVLENLVHRARSELHGFAGKDCELF